MGYRGNVAHTLPQERLLDVLAVRREVGLSEAEAARRLETAGNNRLTEDLPRSARVRRDGQIREIPAHALVPGDILLAAGRQVDESGLTGEAARVGKLNVGSHLEATPVADCTNSAFMNTLVTCGRDKLVVAAIGLSTVMGIPSQLREEAKEVRSPLKRQLGDARRRLGITELIPNPKARMWLILSRFARPTVWGCWHRLLVGNYWHGLA